MAVLLSSSYLKPNIMFFHRRLLIRASLFLNFCVLTYVALHAAQNSTGGSSRSGSSTGTESFTNSNQQIIYSGVINSAVQTESSGSSGAAANGLGFSSLPSQVLSTEIETETSSSLSEHHQQAGGNGASSAISADTEDGAVSEEQQPPPAGSSSSTDSIAAKKMKEQAPLAIDCQERERRFSYSQRGSYWILNHYIQSDNTYRCNESVTYTTHGDVTFLDNIIPLAQRWDGPLSVTVYTPGSDYDLAIRSIAYLRQCTDDHVRQKVSFHFVLDERHFPASLRKLHPQQGPSPLPSSAQSSVSGAVGVGGSTSVPAEAQGAKRVVMVRSSNGQTIVRVEGPAQGDNRSNSVDFASHETIAVRNSPVYPETDSIGLPLADCEKPAPWSTPPQKTYKQIKNLTYPVNVLRNVARLNAPTHYVLASDAELYPSPNMIRLFMDMLRRNESVLHLGRPKVFVLPIFEVYGNQTVPTTKQELVEKLKAGLAVPFHQKVCSYCHSVPKSKEWLLANITDGLHVFHIAKRHKPHQRWEPIYIGTQDDPLYDERLTWEGKSDKMTQGYALCVLDYDFMILDNAFLVHRPGVKIPRREPLRDAMAKKQSAVIRSAIYRELKVLYGHNSNCIL